MHCSISILTFVFLANNSQNRPHRSCQHKLTSMTMTNFKIQRLSEDRRSQVSCLCVVEGVVQIIILHGKSHRGFFSLPCRFQSVSRLTSGVLMADCRLTGTDNTGKDKPSAPASSFTEGYGLVTMGRHGR